MALLPHHADMVGSLLRPARLSEARAAWREGRLDRDELRAIEDEAITDLVRKEEAVGLPAVTDGEFRRDWWHLDFLAELGGIGTQQRERPKDFAGEGDSPPIPVVVGKVQHDHPIFVDAYSFLHGVAERAIPKITIPGPGMANLMGGPAAIDDTAYPDKDKFWDDLVVAYRDEVDALYAAGCRYLQLDDTNLAYLCDPVMRAGAEERGDDPNELPHAYAELINRAIAGRPDDLTVAIHLCRGNYRSTWFAQGGYEPVAEVLFTELDVDAYFLEYDDERSGDFAPLRFVPPGKTVVLGLVTSKRPELEPYELLAARVEEAARYVPMDQLCLSPQCGFASTIEGNALTADEQWAKLAHVVTTAERIWS